MTRKDQNRAYLRTLASQENDSLEEIAAGTTRLADFVTV